LGEDLFISKTFDAVSSVNVRRKDDGDEAWLRDVLAAQWGGEFLVVRGEEIDLLEQSTFIAGERDGIAIFRGGGTAELLLLHAFRDGMGIGTALLDAVATEMRGEGTRHILVTTTNDNIVALRFYQRRGFRLRALRPDAVGEARRTKPSIPLVGENGIPIRDEIDLMLAL
jgi:ribosomal protein S18 acetylase RimI-like enzyme